MRASKCRDYTAWCSTEFPVLSFFAPATIGASTTFSEVAGVCRLLFWPFEHMTSAVSIDNSRSAREVLRVDGAEMFWIGLCRWIEVPATLNPGIVDNMRAVTCSLCDLTEEGWGVSCCGACSVLWLKQGILIINSGGPVG